MFQNVIIDIVFENTRDYVVLVVCVYLFFDIVLYLKIYVTLDLLLK